MIGLSKEIAARVVESTGSFEPAPDPPDLEIQRLVESSFIHPLITEEVHAVADGPELRVEHNQVRNVATTEAGSAIRIVSPDDSHYVAVIVPVLSDRRFLLLGRYRYAIGRWSIEFPRSHFRSSDAGWKRAAEKNLLKETGLKAGTMTLLGAIQPDSSLQGISTIVILAEQCVARKRVLADPRRLIAGMVVMSSDELDMLALRGELSCGVSLAALYLHGIHARRPPSP